MIRDKIKSNGYMPSFENMVLVDNKLYYSEADCHDVYVYDLLSEKTHLVCEISEEPEYGKRLFGGMAFYDEKLVLSPQAAHYGYIVDIVTNSYTKIALPCSGDTNPCFNEAFKYRDIYLKNGAIIIVGASVPRIIMISDASKLMFDGWSLGLNYSQQKQKVASLIQKTCMVDGVIYAPIGASNILLLFDIDSNRFKKMYVGDSHNTYSAICSDGEYVWMVSKIGGQLLKGRINGEFEMIDFSDMCDNVDLEFRYIVYFDGYVFLIPFRGTRILRIHKDGTEMECVYQGTESLYMTAVKGNGRMIISSLVSNKIYVFEKYNEFIVKNMIFPMESVKRRYRDEAIYIMENGFIGEKDSFKLDDFLVLCNA